MKPFAPIVLLLGVSSLSHAQLATPAQREGVKPNPDFGTMHLQTKIGSCKFFNGQGRLEINYTGSLLLHGFKGKYTVSGKLVRQYNAPERGRELYYGKGKIVLIGSFKSLQWFGRDLSAVWYGLGMVRLSGEYYESTSKPGTFESGWYWYGDPTKRQAWPATGSFEYPNPESKYVPPPEPRRREVPKTRT